jgi:DNA helicase-2/ATP-dependent DNA helicase PcrA
MNYSSYQLDIFKFFGTEPLGNALINAVAGSGKTFTLEKSLEYLSPSKSVLISAFNKNIAAEFVTRIKRPNTAIRTSNAFGNSIVKSAFRNAELDPEKTQNILFHRVLLGNDQLMRKMIGPTKRIIALAKALMIPTGEELYHSINPICLEYSIDLPKGMEEDAKQIIAQTFDESIRDTFHYDWNDQLFFPWRFNLPIPIYDVVLVDEYQDTNPIQSWLIENTQGTQIVAGDPWQAIYGWRAATPDAMSKFKSKFNATELPLSICYRCPKTVVAEAKKIVSHIEHAPDAKDGVIDTIKPDQLDKMVDKDSFIICRTTAPLIEKCLDFIKKKIPAQVR